MKSADAGGAGELLAHYAAKAPKGEIVIVIAPGEPPEMPMDLEECVEMLRAVHGLTLKEAIKAAAKLLKMPKSAVYKKMHAPKYP